MDLTDQLVLEELLMSVLTRWSVVISPHKVMKSKAMIGFSYHWLLSLCVRLTLRAAIAGFSTPETETEIEGTPSNEKSHVRQLLHDGSFIPLTCQKSHISCHSYC